MATAVRVAGVTVNPVDPETLPRLAEMFVVPTDAVLARPSVPRLLLMVATAVVLELQVAVAVRSSVLPSL
jgi:hypothetical protein